MVADRNAKDNFVYYLHIYLLGSSKMRIIETVLPTCLWSRSVTTLAVVKFKEAYIL